MTCLVLAAIVTLLVVVGISVGIGVMQTAVELLPIVIPGLISWRVKNRTLATLAMAWALMACSSTLVHQTEGLIEAHFLFFVLLPLVSLYQDWRAFLGAIGFVIVSHAVVGTLWPASMYNHSAAIDDPVVWAMIHAGFVAVLVLVLVVQWRFAEIEQGRSEQAVQSLEQTEVRLSQAQKLESVGQLAAGVAHEINTPVQYLSDNAAFLRESFLTVVDVVEQLTDIARETDAATVDRLLLDADMEFLLAEIPGALEHSRDGLNRVSEIVRAMKDFSHPGNELAEVDLNRAISSTLTVSRNEWKYVAEMTLELDQDLPFVQCYEGPIKQVMLNMIVNAAHAIADAHRTSGMGRITVSTALVGDQVEIRIADDGCGMPLDTQHRMFDPFFTTKEVGRGTGQGLTMVHQIVTAHDGTIAVESEVGIGSTFVISLPVVGVSASAAPLGS